MRIEKKGLGHFRGGSGGLHNVRILCGVAGSKLRPVFSGFPCLPHWASFTSSSQFLPGIWLSAELWDGRAQGRKELVPPVVGVWFVQSGGSTGLCSFPSKR